MLLTFRISFLSKEADATILQRWMPLHIVRLSTAPVNNNVAFFIKRGVIFLDISILEGTFLG